MKRKLLILLALYSLLSVISCHPTDTYHQTRIDSVSVFAGTFNDSCARVTMKEAVPAGEFCLILKIGYADTTESTGISTRRSASLPLTSSCFAAYDPPLSPHYRLSDSLVSVWVTSMMMQPNMIRLDSRSDTLFTAWYSERVREDDLIRSLAPLKYRSLAGAIDSLLIVPYAHCNHPYLTLVLVPRQRMISGGYRFFPVYEFGDGRGETGGACNIRLTD